MIPASRLWAHWVLEWCKAAGARHVCLAPGSRSTPLVLAAEALQFEHHLHWDERALGFYALGLAKSLGEPVVLVTTSGSAVANLAPAMVEAFQTGVPLIALTGDRPPELHGCGANQSIPQADLLATCTVARLTLPPYHPGMSPDTVRDQVGDVLAQVRYGPVHLNLMFREPFYPDSDASQPVPEHYPVQVPAWRPSPEPIPPEPAGLAAWLERETPVWVVALDGCQHALAELEAFVGDAPVQVLADVQSGWHGRPGAFFQLDRLLNHPDFQARIGRPARVLQLGSRPVSKRLTQWLAALPLGVLGILAPDAEPTCIGHNAAWHWRVPVAEGLAQLAGRIRGERPPSPAWPESTHTSGQLQWTEIEWLRYLQRRLIHARQDPDWFVGNSLAIRLMDTFSVRRPGGSGGWRVTANRGASGIDGLIATLAGLANADPEGPPLIALIGDLSALHDLTSLTLLRQTRRPVSLVILNNDGGAIFRWLPVPDEPQVAARYRCAHGLNFNRIAAWLDVPYDRTLPGEAAAETLIERLAEPGLHMLELALDPALSRARWAERLA